jgi:hypothetical protein
METNENWNQEEWMEGKWTYECECHMEGHALTGTKSMTCAQLLVVDVTMYTSRPIEREVESIGIYCESWGKPWVPSGNLT